MEDHTMIRIGDFASNVADTVNRVAALPNRALEKVLGDKLASKVELLAKVTAVALLAISALAILAVGAVYLTPIALTALTATVAFLSPAVALLSGIALPVAGVVSGAVVAAVTSVSLKTALIVTAVVSSASGVFAFFAFGNAKVFKKPEGISADAEAPAAAERASTPEAPKASEAPADAPAHAPA